MTNLSLRASQAFIEDQLLVLQPGVSILQVTISFTVDACVPLWFCVIQGAFWVTHERQQERESVQLSVQGCMYSSCVLQPTHQKKSISQSQLRREESSSNGSNRKDKEGWRESNGTGWVTGSRKVDTWQGIRGHSKRMQSRMHRAAGQVKEGVSVRREIYILGKMLS